MAVDESNATEPQAVAGQVAPGRVNSAPRLNENRYFSSEFDKQIRAQRTNLLIAGGFTFIILMASMISTLFLFRTTGLGTSALEYMKLGPLAISGIALPFPLRMYLSYRVRIPVYEGFKRLFDEAAASGTKVEPHLVEDARSALKALHKLD